MEAVPTGRGPAGAAESAAGLYLVVDNPQPEVADAPYHPPTLTMYTRLARFSSRTQRWEPIATEPEPAAGAGVRERVAPNE